MSVWYNRSRPTPHSRCPREQWLARARRQSIHPIQAVCRWLPRHGVFQSPHGVLGGSGNAVDGRQRHRRGGCHCLRAHRGRADDGRHLRRRHGELLRRILRRVHNHRQLRRGPRRGVRNACTSRSPNTWPDYLEAAGRKNRLGYLAVGVPGNLKCWCHLVERYGRLDLDTVTQPAIRYAENGFPASAYLVKIIADNRDGPGAFSRHEGSVPPERRTAFRGTVHPAQGLRPHAAAYRRERLGRAVRG